MWLEKANYPVTMMAGLLHIARSGYYKWIKQTNGGTVKPTSPRARERAWIAKLVLQDFRALVDAPMEPDRFHAQLARLGVNVSLWLVRKIMAALGLVAVQPRASKHNHYPSV
jgi:hypothetical protein